MLTASKVKEIKPTDKPLKVVDRDGLYLYVSTTGAKSFRYDYRDNGKRLTKTIGAYPALSLPDARKALEDFKADAVRRRKEIPTFKEIAETWGKKKVAGWGEKDKTYRRLELWIYPKLGALRVDEIKAGIVLDCLEVIEQTGKIETAHRCKNIISRVLRHAVICGYIESDCTVNLHGALASKKGGNFEAITDPAELRSALRTIDRYSGSIVVKSYLQIAFHVFMRPSELRLLKWGNVDFGEQLIRIVSTKKQKDLITPISDYVLERLHLLKDYGRGSDWVFPSLRVGDIGKRPISENAALVALERMGIRSTVHGIRGTAKTLLTETLGVSDMLVELQLSHRVVDHLGSAYQRGAFLAHRVDMMCQWSEYLLKLKAGENTPSVRRYIKSA